MVVECDMATKVYPCIIIFGFVAKCPAGSNFFLNLFRVVSIGSYKGTNLIWIVSCFTLCLSSANYSELKVVFMKKFCFES